MIPQFERMDLDTFMSHKVAIRPEAFLRALGILRHPVSNIELLPVRLRTRMTRNPDVLVLLTEPGQNKRIIQLEFQSRNHPKMYLRMREYDLLLEKKYPEYEREQYVIYLGKSEPKMVRQGAHRNGTFWYRLIDFRKVNPHWLTDSRLPYLIILSVLTQTRNADIAEKAEEACRLLDELEAEGVIDLDEKIAYLYDLQMMVTIRNPKLTLLIQTEKSMKLDPTVLPSYKKGKLDGLIEGERIGEIKGERIGEIKGEIKAKLKICLQMWKIGFEPELIRSLSELTDLEWKEFLEYLKRNSE